MRSNQVTFGLLLWNNLLHDWASVSSYVKSVPREMPGRNDIEKTLWADPPRTQPTARLAHDRIICNRLVGVERSGRTMARTGLRMMPTFSIIPPKIPYGGFSPVRLQGWPIGRHLPASGAHVSRPPGLHPAFVPTAFSVSFSALCRSSCALKHRHSSG
jgi:hypothetical protein